MTCETCRAACSHQPVGQRASEVHAAESAICGCEQFSVSEFSPGAVADSEIIHLLISDPQHLLDGKLGPSGLIQLDRGGLSTLRDTAEDEEFRQTCLSLRERATEKENEWFLHAVCAISVAEVRYKDGARFVCVYDTGLQAKPNHADIMGPDLKALAPTETSKGEIERRQRARIRALIEKIGNGFASPSTFRNGRLNDFSRIA